MMLTRATRNSASVTLYLRQVKAAVLIVSNTILGTDQLNEHNQVYVFCIKCAGDLFRFINRKKQNQAKSLRKQKKLSFKLILKFFKPS